MTNLGRIPDFILHTPSCREKNLAVIEFKLASNNRTSLEADLSKLAKFGRVEQVNYQHLVEVIIGKEDKLKVARERVDELETPSGEKILVISYNVDKRDTERREITYEPDVHSNEPFEPSVR